MNESGLSAPYALAPASLTDALFASLRQRIIDGNIAPGERLTELRVAKEYEVARPTAKACLERLTTNGLLRRTAHKTAVVPRLDADELTDLFMAREAVESSAVEHLALARRIPQAAREANADQQRAAETKDFSRQVAGDVAFHLALVEGTGSARLVRMHELIMGEVHLTMGQYQAHKTADPAQVAGEHQDILDAIAAGGIAEARRHMRLHLDHAQERLLARLEAENHPI